MSRSFNYADKPVRQTFTDFKDQVEKEAGARSEDTAAPVVYRGRCWVPALTAIGIAAAVAAVALTVILLLGAAKIIPMTSMLLGINGGLIGISLLISILTRWSAGCVRRNLQHKADQVVPSQNNKSDSLKSKQELIGKVEAIKPAITAFNEDYKRWERDKNRYQKEQLTEIFEKGCQTYKELGPIRKDMKKLRILDHDIIVAKGMGIQLTKLAKAIGQEFADPYEK